MGQLSRLFHIRNRLAKENDVRPDMVAVGVQSVHTGHQPLIGQLVTGQRVFTFLVPDRAHFHQFAMQVQHVGTASTLVQVIHVLGDYTHVKVLLQLHKAQMGGIGLCVDQLLAPLVVELVDERRVAQIALVARHFHHGIILPQTISITEGLDATLGTDSSTRRDH